MQRARACVQEAQRQLSLLGKDYGKVDVQSLGFLTCGRSLRIAVADNSENVQLYEYAPQRTLPSGNTARACTLIHSRMQCMNRVIRHRHRQWHAADASRRDALRTRDQLAASCQDARRTREAPACVHLRLARWSGRRYRASSRERLQVTLAAADTSRVLDASLCWPQPTSLSQLCSSVHITSPQVQADTRW